jgi:D-alanyl-D-alanine dipeptidase/carboxypeptidase
MKEILLSHSRIYSGSLILVNSIYSFSQHAPDVLTSVGRQKDILMERQAAVLLDKLMSEINGWDFIVPVSGYRPFDEQQKIWNDTVKTDGIEFARKYVAYPGHSEHQTGLAIDLGLKQEKIDFICPEFPYHGICQKFRELAADYGFIERYPSGKEAITGIGHEPWHFRYVGAPHAKIIKQNNLTLEEYMDFIKKHTYNDNPYIISIGNHIVHISYLNADNISRTILNINEKCPYSISGNNSDGFIITEWRQLHENQTDSDNRLRSRADEEYLTDSHQKRRA